MERTIPFLTPMGYIDSLARADDLFKKCKYCAEIDAIIISGTLDVLTVPSELDISERQKRGGCKSNKTRLVATEIN